MSADDGAHDLEALKAEWATCVAQPARNRTRDLAVHAPTLAPRSEQQELATRVSLSDSEEWRFPGLLGAEDAPHVAGTNPGRAVPLRFVGGLDISFTKSNDTDASSRWPFSTSRSDR